jgi:hypothetical protein
MIWTILGVFVAYFLIKFLMSLSNDNDDLADQSLSEKFAVIVRVINNVSFNGNAEIITIDKREFYLFEEGNNQMVFFMYSTGSLTITWKYKYFQKEIIHEKHFDNVRNLSIFEQTNRANQMINEMELVVAKHKNHIF